MRKPDEVPVKCCMLFFDGLNISVRTGCPAERDDHIDSISACVITVIEWQDILPLGGIRSVSKSGWFPAFWRKAEVIRGAVELLQDGVDHPSPWAIGASECWEATMLDENAIPQRQSSRRDMPERQSFSGLKMLKLTDLSNIRVPPGQGSQHYDGIRFAILSGSSISVEALERWVAHMNGYEGGISNDLLVSDTCAPPGTVAWMSAFGEECRQHAVLAKKGIDSLVLAHNLADRLHLPFIRISSSLNKFRDWEFEHVLPD